jgi:GT2 family glycosyltransferase
MKHPEIFAVILKPNELEDTIECLESLKKTTYPNYARLS